MSIVPAFNPATGASGGAPSGGGGGGASWQVVGELDFTGLDVQDLTPPDANLQTFTLTKGGVAYATLYVDYSGSGLVYTVGASASGIRAEWVSGVSNYLTAVVDFASLIGKTAPMSAADIRGMYAIQYRFADLAWPGANSERLHAGIAAANTNGIANGDSMWLTLGDNGLGGSIVGLYCGADVTEYTTAGVQPSSCMMEQVLMNGQFADGTVVYNAGYSAPYPTGYGPMLLRRTPTIGQPYPVDLASSWVGACWRRKLNATWTGIRVLRYQ